VKHGFASEYGRVVHGLGSEESGSDALLCRSANPVDTRATQGDEIDVGALQWVYSGAITATSTSRPVGTMHDFVQLRRA
jgi:hypothetical protein